MQREHLLSKSPRRDCLSNGSDGHIKHDLAQQHHQLCKQAQVEQVGAIDRVLKANGRLRYRLLPFVALVHPGLEQKTDSCKLFPLRW